MPGRIRAGEGHRSRRVLGAALPLDRAERHRHRLPGEGTIRRPSVFEAFADGRDTPRLPVEAEDPAAPTKSTDPLIGGGPTA